MTDKFTANLLDLHALARALCERIRVLGEVQHMIDDDEASALAGALASAAVAAAETVRVVAARMWEEENYADH